VTASSGSFPIHHSPITFTIQHYAAKETDSIIQKKKKQAKGGSFK